MARSAVFILTLLGGIALDLWTKDLAFDALPEHSSYPIEVIPGFFYIVHAENDGAMWSLFQGLPTWVWISLRGAVAALILLYYIVHRRAFPFWIHVAFGLVLAGALGNLHDNVTGNGKVRDFIRWVFWGWPFPTFNIADSMICIGAGLLLLWFIFLDPSQRGPRPLPEAKAA